VGKIASCWPFSNVSSRPLGADQPGLKIAHFGRQELQNFRQSITRLQLASSPAVPTLPLCTETALGSLARA
jgi:hypothetical protein